MGRCLADAVWAIARLVRGLLITVTQYEREMLAAGFTFLHLWPKNDRLSAGGGLGGLRVGVSVSRRIPRG